MLDDFRIGEWEVRPRLNRISRGDDTVRLEPNFMRVLLCLARNPGEVVTRAQILEEVWNDTAVEEHALNRAISGLRKSLGDNHQNPRYIETVRKVGYRLIAPLSPALREAQAPADASAPISDIADRAWLRSWWFISLAAGLILLLGSIAAINLVTSSEASLAPPMPLTSLRGNEYDPAFSPGSSPAQAAFAWGGETGDNLDIYVKTIGTEALLRLTEHPGDDRKPAWSPDGLHIAFIRDDANDCGIFMIPSIGGQERKLISCASSRIDSITWSPDGNLLAYSERGAQGEPYSIFLLRLSNLERRRLTSPPPLHLGDQRPSFSPDGRRLAFARSAATLKQYIYLMPVEGGEPQQITFEEQKIRGLDWLADDNLIFSSDREGSFTLWKVPARGGEPQWLAASGEDAQYPAASRAGNAIAYEKWHIDSDIWSVEMGDSNGERKRLIASTKPDAYPEFSPDGKHIAFVTSRSGRAEIWVCASDGSDQRRLAPIQSPFGAAPRWSPDSRRIIFSSREGGNADIYVVELDGGAPRRITSDASDDLAPAWSKDGRWIYFSSERSGSRQIWKVPAEGGEAHQVTRSGGFHAQESPDGRFVYYTKLRQPGLWQAPIDGGEERLVIAHLKAKGLGNWLVTGEGIYFADQTGEGASLKLYHLKTSHYTEVATLPEMADGISISPDHRRLLYTRAERMGSDIMLLKNYE